MSRPGSIKVSNSETGNTHTSKRRGDMMRQIKSFLNSDVCWLVYEDSLLLIVQI